MTPNNPSQISIGPAALSVLKEMERGAVINKYRNEAMYVLAARASGAAIRRFARRTFSELANSRLIVFKPGDREYLPAWVISDKGRDFLEKSNEAR